MATYYYKKHFLQTVDIDENTQGTYIPELNTFNVFYRLSGTYHNSVEPPTNLLINYNDLWNLFRNELEPDYDNQYELNYRYDGTVDFETSINIVNEVNDLNIMTPDIYHNYNKKYLYLNNKLYIPSINENFANYYTNVPTFGKRCPIIFPSPSILNSGIGQGEKKYSRFDDNIYVNNLGSNRDFPISIPHVSDFINSNVEKNISAEQKVKFRCRSGSFGGIIFSSSEYYNNNYLSCSSEYVPNSSQRLYGDIYTPMTGSNKLTNFYVNRNSNTTSYDQNVLYNYFKIKWGYIDDDNNTHIGYFGSQTSDTITFRIRFILFKELISASASDYVTSARINNIMFNLDWLPTKNQASMFNLSVLSGGAIEQEAIPFYDNNLTNSSIICKIYTTYNTYTLTPGGEVNLMDGLDEILTNRLGTGDNGWDSIRHAYYGSVSYYTSAGTRTFPTRYHYLLCSMPWTLGTDGYNAFQIFPGSNYYDGGNTDTAISVASILGKFSHGNDCFYSSGETYYSETYEEYNKLAVPVYEVYTVSIGSDYYGLYANPIGILTITDLQYNINENLSTPENHNNGYISLYELYHYINYQTLYVCPNYGFNQGDQNPDFSGTALGTYKYSGGKLNYSDYTTFSQLHWKQTEEYYVENRASDMPVRYNEPSSGTTLYYCSDTFIPFASAYYGMRLYDYSTWGGNSYAYGYSY